MNTLDTRNQQSTIGTKCASNGCEHCANSAHHCSEEKAVDLEVDVRSSMETGYEVIDQMLTWVTGKPLPGQKPKLILSPMAHLDAALACLIAGVFATIAIMNSAPVWWPLLLISWMFTVSGARKIQTMILHQAVHSNFLKNEQVNRLLSNTLGALVMVQPFEAYQVDHLKHHSKYLATLDDIDVQFFLALGLLPGMPREILWMRLWWTLFSPKYHFMFLRARLAQNFIEARPYRRILALVFAVTILVLAIKLDGLPEYLVAWIFPLTFLYHCSALLQFMSEHRWLRVRLPGEPGKLALARLSIGRFCGEAAPVRNQAPLHSLVAWLRWVFRMLFVHLPARLFVLVGDLPQHDYHHRHPKSPDWNDAAFARQRDIEAGCPNWPEAYSDVWGLDRAIDEVFTLLSELPPVEVLPSWTSEELGDVMTDM